MTKVNLLLVLYKTLQWSVNHI